MPSRKNEGVDMKTSTFHLPGCLLALLGCCLLSAGAWGADEQDTAQPVARVNGVEISQEEFNSEINIYMQRHRRPESQLSEEQMAELRSQILESIIERELLYQKSVMSGIAVESAEVEAQLETIKKRFVNEAGFDKALEQMGMTEAEVKKEIERGIAIRKLIDREVAASIVVADEESRAFYRQNPDLFKQPEQIRASHILVKADPKASDAEKARARQKIESVQNKIAQGDDFADLAREYSEGPSSVRGGDLGYFQRGQMVKAFEDTAFGLKINEVSPIVETPFGYHIIKLFDRKPEKKMDYSQVKDRIEERLKGEKVEKGARQYIDGLKAGARIDRNL
jgi:peptidyl-prolyl cis-trans isomerase C